MNKQQRELKERIRKTYRKPNGFTYVPPSWPKTLWDQSMAEIVEYILDRYNETDDEVEYYTCMVYLACNNNKYNDLLIEWKDSTNYQRLLKSLDKENKKTTKIVNTTSNSKDKTKIIAKKDKTKVNNGKIVPKKLSNTVSITKNFI